MAKRVLDGFVLHERIGLGSTASVWSAEDPTGRIVALKELHPHLSADKESVSRFEREARIAASIRHPSIVEVVDWGCDAGRWFIAFEHVDGVDLRRVLQDGPLPPGAMLSVAIELLTALTAAHERGVIHRDVKPANVLLTRDGHAKLADFSIARNADLPAMTMTGALVGTPAYMSPEQVWGREVDARTDLWSVGLILWEMLTGRRPHDGSTATRELVASSAPPTLPSGAPPFIGREIVRALQPASDERPESAIAFREALRVAARLDGVIADRFALVARIESAVPPPPVWKLGLAPKIARRIARPLFALAGLALVFTAPFATQPHNDPAIHEKTSDVFSRAAVPEKTSDVFSRVETVAESEPTPTPEPEPRPTPAAPRIASKSALSTMLTVSAKPRAEVWLNGMYVGATPLWEFPVAPGRHQVAVRRPTCSPRNLTVNAQAGRATSVDLALACGVDPL